MGQNSTIEWTDHTFNPWWGCSKISPGCANCYAETWAKRVGAKVWGAESARRFFGEKHWNEPLHWNRTSTETGIRKRVFCASMADVFEDRADLDPARAKLWKLIGETPNLDWLLLTKRPARILASVPWLDKWSANVWIGTTVEDQERADERLPFLLKCPAQKRFLSCEPLIGAVDLSPWIERDAFYPIDWVIAGGESGARARPMLPTWARSLRDQCKAGQIPFHFKQWGHWAPSPFARPGKSIKAFWDAVSGEEILMEARGKKDAGRDLDGRTWDELPTLAYG
jgi:protein gp37